MSRACVGAGCDDECTRRAQPLAAEVKCFLGVDLAGADRVPPLQGAAAVVCARMAVGMVGITIAGTGRYLPGKPYSNTSLARVMDTNDEWIRQRTGISERHFCPSGQGVSDLALPAARAALEAAGCEARDLDYILFNTMTPDHVFPGSGPLLGAALGCPGVPALDLRAQCAAMIYSLQVAAGLMAAPDVRRVLLVGAEAHAGFMPWNDWAVLEGDHTCTPEAFARATQHRGWAVVFGDGAGALVLERTEREGTGILAIDVHSDGRFCEELMIPAGFRQAPYADANALKGDRFIPQMNGKEVYRHAVNRLPETVRAACSKANVTLDDVDWFIAHQANDRINAAVRDRLGVPEHKVPSNIARYGNTSAATIPILLDEMARDGRLVAGQLLCFLALGAGLHWGAAVMRI
jgi:3-oxoacyl-[acyl-carrier-protein] synthase III